MRGKISVVSELNKGTVFIIEIPVKSEIALLNAGINIPQGMAQHNKSFQSNNEDESSSKKLVSKNKDSLTGLSNLSFQVGDS